MEELDKLFEKRKFLAEAVSDYTREQHWLNSFDKFTLASLRYDNCCKYSPIGEYRCYKHVKIKRGFLGDLIAVDVGLAHEVDELIHKHGISTVGCCCGHGKMNAFIQVADQSVQKMHELGYKQLPVDEYGNGVNCFEPKTYLPIIKPKGKTQ